MATFEIEVDGEVYEVEGVETPEEAYAAYQQMGGVTPPDGEMEHDFNAMNMVKNIPGSGAQLVKDTYSAFRHPIQTVSAMTDLVQAGYAASKGQVPDDPEDRAALQAFNGMIEGRYGGWEQFQKTLEEDPLGVMSDVSALVTAGGSGMATLPGRIGKIGSTVAKTGAMLEPIGAASTGAQKLAKGAVRKGMPEKMYESAIKPSTTMDDAARSRATEAGLRNWVGPSSRGVDKISDLTDSLNSQIDDLITKHGDTGATVPAGVIHQEIAKLRSKLGGPRMGAEADLLRLDAIEESFSRHMENLGKDSLTIPELQYFKTQGYKDINWNRRNPQTSPVDEKVAKATTGAARQSLEELVPGLGDLNKELGALLDLDPEVRRAAGRTSNRNMIGLGAPSKIGVGGGLGYMADSPKAGMAIGGGLALLENPKIKAGIASALYHIQNNDIKWLRDNLMVPGVRLALEQTGRINEVLGVEEEVTE